MGKLELFRNREWLFNENYIFLLFLHTKVSKIVPTTASLVIHYLFMIYACSRSFIIVINFHLFAKVT